MSSLLDTTESGNPIIIGETPALHLISYLVEVSLEELFQKGAIDDYQERESFTAECEIENYGINEPLYMVTLCGWQVFIWWMRGTLEAYHAQSIAIDTCAKCTAIYPESELRTVRERKLCDACQHTEAEKVEV